MLLEKKPLSVEEIEAQTALELPERETPVTVVIGCLALCVGQIIVRDVDVDAAVQLCAQVEAITLNGTQLLTCDIRQR